MIRVILDTNIFVSALNFGGVPNKVLILLEAGCFTLCLSQSLINEIRRVMIEDFQWSEADLREALDPIISLAELVDPQATVTASRDPKDDHVLAAAVEAHATVIVTGDGDLLTMTSFRDIPILTPRGFLEWMESEHTA